MKKAVIFGATNTGLRIYDEIKDKFEIILFLDEDSEKWGATVRGKTIYSPNKIIEIDYDCVFVGVLTYYEQVMECLRMMMVPEDKIIDKYVALPTKARIEFLENSYEILKRENISKGCVAELGVYKGDFAKEINRVFYEQKFYMFDTFDGFDKRDDDFEKKQGFSEITQKGYFSDTSPGYVLGRMPYREKCEIRKGYFPDTTVGLENERFMFVNIDADLYAPILAGLEFFISRMIPGGIVLVHDYFSTAFTGAKEAVDKYADKYDLNFLPIGDTLSVALRV